MSIFFVYILETINTKGEKSYYTGYTKDLKRRLSEHKNGTGAKYCRGKSVELKYFETYTTRKEAMQRELEIKTFTQDKKIELIKDLEKS